MSFMRSCQLFIIYGLMICDGVYCLLLFFSKFYSAALKCCCCCYCCCYSQKPSWQHSLIYCKHDHSHVRLCFFRMLCDDFLLLLVTIVWFSKIKIQWKTVRSAATYDSQCHAIFQEILLEVTLFLCVFQCMCHIYIYVKIILLA